MIQYYDINLDIINNINKKNIKVLFILNDTKKITYNLLNKIKTKCNFKIFGGINEIEIKKRYIKRVTYSLEEMKKIIYNFEIIEEGINNENIVYIYNYLRENIEYYPNEKNDKKIRSLYAIVTKKAVCSGYSLILKELLTRINVNCKYIKHFNHIWNMVEINNKWYEVDLTWDAFVYSKYKNSNLHFFGNNINLSEKHYNKSKCNNYYHNDILNTYTLSTIELERKDKSKYKLTLLPIGFKKKYYLYEEDNIKCIVSSYDDMEIILTENNKIIIEKYVNDFYAKERILKNLNDNISNLGRGYFDNKIFYKQNDINKEDYIEKIDINSIVYINTIDKKYKIDDNYNMEVLNVKNTKVNSIKFNY